MYHFLVAVLKSSSFTGFSLTKREQEHDSW